MLTVSLGGCIKTWKPGPIGPVETIAESPERVRLTLVDSSAITLSVPRIADGVIVSPDGRAELDAVTVVETRKIDVLANVMPYGLALAAAGLVGWAVADEPEYKVPPLFPWRTRRDSSSTSEPAFSYAGPRPAASGPRPGGPDR